MHSALAPALDFLGLDGVTHLHTAAECPMLKAAADAVAEYTRQKSCSEADRARHTTSCKAGLARLLDAAPDKITLLGSASDAINAMAGTVDFQPGDNVVISDLKLSSVGLLWLRTRAAVDDHTRLVALSHVSYVNGWRHDIESMFGLGTDEYGHRRTPSAVSGISGNAWTGCTRSFGSRERTRTCVHRLL